MTIRFWYPPGNHPGPNAHRSKLVGWDEHAPPHFHVIYGEYKATVNIRELGLGEGELPRRARQLVLDWAELHQAELLADWDLCQSNQHPNPIDPLK